MNNLLTFWLAPITALFNPQVFRDAAKRTGGKGVLYLLYLSMLAGLFTLILVAGVVSPVANDFIQWAQKNAPVVIWTPEGVSLENGEKTLLLTHPQYGPLVAFDLTKTEVTEKDMDKASVLVTSTKVFIKRGPGQIEGRDITKAGIQTDKQLPPRIRITGEVVGRLLSVVKSSIALIVTPGIFVLSFLLLLFSNLLYSLAGLLFNLMRKQRLEYGAIFSLTCFATTVSFTLAWLQILTPLRSLPLPLVAMILLNLVYMFIAFKVSDETSAGV